MTSPPRPVTVYAFRLVDFKTPVVEFEARCGSGTYVRSLAHTLGEVLGCGAHLAGLRRLSAGDLTVDRALSADRVEGLIKEGRAGEVVLPLEALLPGLPKVVLTETGEGRLQKSRSLAPGDVQSRLPQGALSGTDPADAPDTCRLFSLTGRFLGLARSGPDPETLVPFLILAP